MNISSSNISHQTVYGSCRHQSLTCGKKILIAFAIIAALAATAAVVTGHVSVLPGEFGFSATVVGATLFGISCATVAYVILRSYCCRPRQGSSTMDDHDYGDSWLNHFGVADSVESIRRGRHPEDYEGDPQGIAYDFANLSGENSHPSGSSEPAGPVPLTDAVRNRQSYQFSRHGHSTEVIKIKVSEQDIKDRPEYHLKQLTDLIETHATEIDHVNLRVKFLGNDGTRQIGQDAGGLSRNYISVLFTSVIANSCVLFGRSATNGLAFPTINVDSRLSPEEQARRKEAQMDVCRRLGMLCGFFMENFAIGGNFDSSFFSALQAFSTEWINASSIDELPLAEKISIIEKFLFNDRAENQSVEAEPQVQDQEKIVNFLKTDAATFSQVQLQTIFNLAYGLEIEFSREEPSASRQHFIAEFGDDAEVLLGLTEEQYQRIIGDEDNRAFIKEILTEMFLEVYSPRLQAFHAFAQGMKAMLIKGQVRRENPEPDAQILYGDMAWHELCSRYDYLAFAEKLQGSIDPNKIASSILCSSDANQFMRTQAEWLRKWIRNPLTPLQDIKDFLKFATGGTSLPDGKSVAIKRQSERRIGRDASGREVYGYLPAPEAHTCFYQIELSPEPTGPRDGANNRSEENFINCVKAVIGGTGTFSIV